MVPDSYDEGTAVLIGCATVYLNNLNRTNNRSTRRHDKSLPCAICKQTGHDFDGCPALNDHDFLRSPVIKSSLYWANHAKLLAKSVIEAKQQKLTHKQNQLEAALHSIDFAYNSASSSEYEDDDDDDSDSDF